MYVPLNITVTLFSISSGTPHDVTSAEMLYPPPVTGRIDVMSLVTSSALSRLAPRTEKNKGEGHYTRYRAALLAMLLVILLLVHCLDCPLESPL
jgi:hypothetical protein